MNSSADKISKVLARALMVLLVGAFINGCSVEPNPGRSIYMGYGYSKQDTSSMSVEQLLNGMRGTISKTSTSGRVGGLLSGTPVGTVYPFPSKVTLDITAVNNDESIVYNAAQINSDFNNNQFDVESDGSINIPYTTFPLVIPNDFTAYFTLTIYNSSGYQYFQGTLSIGPSDTINDTVTFPLKVAIDPSITINCSGAGDSDGDGLCDVYEDIFINAAGKPDIDGDTIINSNDSDSDGDGTIDSLEGSTDSVDGYPLFIHKNIAPTLGSNVFTVIKGQTLNMQGIQYTDPDNTDTHTVSIDTTPVSGGSASMQTSTAFTYTPPASFVGTDTFNISIRDQNNVLDGSSVSGTVTINVIYNPYNHAPNAVDDGTRLHRIASLTTDSKATNGNSASPNSNDNGRFTAFWSAASNLDTYATSFPDLYLRDNMLKITRQVTVGFDTANNKYVAPDAGPNSIAEKDTGGVAFSDDGSHLVFSSAASNLDTSLAGGAKGYRNIYDFNQATNTIFQITNDNLDCSGGPIDGDSSEPVISGDGTIIAFTSTISQMPCYNGYLIRGQTGTDTNGASDIYISDLGGYTKDLISKDTSDSQQGNGSSYSPAISDDGSLIAFVSESTNFGSDTSGQANIYLKNRGDTSLTYITKANGGGAADGPSTSPDINSDGTVVVFQSDATNLSKSTDSNGLSDIYLWNGSTITKISNGVKNTQSNGISRVPKVSKDGRFVLFSSKASNLISGDTNGVEDIFLYDTASGLMQRLSVNSNGVEGNGASTQPHWSDNGQYIVFTTLATNLDTSMNDTNGRSDIIRMQLTDLFTFDTNNLLVNVGANDSDVDSGDTLTTSIAYSALGGSLVDNMNLTYTYTPTTKPNFHGLDLFRYILSDDQNGSNTAYAYISVGANYPPIAVADSFTINLADGATLLDVVQNDYDESDTSLTLNSVDATSFLGAKLSISGNKVLYTPNSTGNDSFNYTVIDSKGLTSTVNVSVTIN